MKSPAFRSAWLKVRPASSLLDGGVAVTGMTVMPLEQARGSNPIIDKLADRGMNSVGMDLVFRTVTSPGDLFEIGYSFRRCCGTLAALTSLWNSR